MVLILVLAAGAYLAYLNGWIRIGPSSDRTITSPADTAVLTSGDWEPLTPDGAARARTGIESLGRRSGPVYSTLTAGELASYIFSEMGRQLPPSAQDVRAAVREGRLYVRATVRLSDLGGDQILGPLAGLLGEREQMQFGGNFRVIRPGLAEFKVEEIRLRDFRVPRAAIPRLVGQLRRSAPPAGVSPDALPLEIPRYIADVRLSQGKITLYKAVQ